MSPRRPRPPRVGPAVPGDAPEAPRDREPRAEPATQPVPTVPPVTDPAAPAASSAPAPPAPEPEAAVIDLQRVQQRREASAGPRRAEPRPPRPSRGSRAAAAPASRRRAPLPEPVPARQITGRSLLVVAVLLVAAVLVAPTLRTFLNQQLEISTAREDIARKKEQQAQYEDTIRRWDDPDYVAQQARERLDLVMPGETLYTVTGVPSPEATAPEEAAPPTDQVNPRLPWAEGLWDTVVRSSGA